MTQNYPHKDAMKRLINSAWRCDEAEKFMSFSSRLVKKNLTKTPHATPVLTEKSSEAAR